MGTLWIIFTTLVKLISQSKALKICILWRLPVMAMLYVNNLRNLQKKNENSGTEIKYSIEGLTAN